MKGAERDSQGALSIQPIGFVRSPFLDKASAPRQPFAARGVRATIELVKGLDLEHAVEDLALWSHIWVLFWFHLNSDWKPKVLPPRSDIKRGVLATRAPHRPNPIGMSVVRLDSVEGRILGISDVDMIDGTPVIDIKPYVPYADVVADANTGWLDPDPEAQGPAASHVTAQTGIDPKAAFEVRWEEGAQEKARYLVGEHALDVCGPIDAALSLGPEPHPYRRIKRDQDGFILAWKSWRARFRLEARTVIVEDLRTGYRARELAPSAGAEEPADLAIHRAFVTRFPKKDA